MNKNDYVHLLKEACGDKCNVEYNPCIFRQAADSLAALKPVAYIENHKAGQNLSWSQDDLPYAKATPLYALDEVKHD